jgi:hypothetical protein
VQKQMQKMKEKCKNDAKSAKASVTLLALKIPFKPAPLLPLLHIP